MEITLNHTIVPAYDNIESAKFYEELFGFQFVKVWGHFAVVKVNSTLTFDFVTKEKCSSMHYAFKVSEKQFDEIFERIKTGNIEFGSSPSSQDDGKINNLYGGRGVYFKDPNGHVLEIITADYIID
jgi:catechol 2,3-dioxygenase-like lactoylglutathione lyase family enzyme